MKINHCNITFKPYDIWFLYDNATDKNRRLLLGKCPNCKKDIVVLIEERKSDNRIFKQVESGQKAGEILDRAIAKKDVIYSASELSIKQGKGSPLGLCYFENKEIHNHKGEIIRIRRTRCDFYGQKENYQEIAS
jgi:hypothetical protein